ncbi:uroporphyrinogen-III synthase [Sediminivirga luteola]|uniref:uroporphyrinogen-III synthase n=1 Tax=Sediminivirga luteola TaxID=1774748 RepID=UPI001E540A4D|nr:uroporphyrinogen-III synthase [Sediminivirga luteola]MCI2264732.1 uroporphyrinogen-III synthase [Sediminivirga luteola]
MSAVSSGNPPEKKKTAPVLRPAVSFVGTGPGDPGLITARAIEAIERAAVVVTSDPTHMELVDRYAQHGPQILDAQELGNTGRVRGRRLAALAGEYGRVVRLLCDDGILFAPTTDEAAACRRAGMSFEIVPGVGLPAGISAYTGTPLTDGRVRSVRLVAAGKTAHLDMTPHRNTGHVLAGSLVDIEDSVCGLIDAGWDPETEVVICSGGTTATQVTADTTLGALRRHVADLAEVSTPEERIVVLVGPGNALRQELEWFESKPLFGWQIIIPRTKEQGAATVEALAELGAVGTIVPTISVEPPRSPQKMERAMRGLVTGDYRWVGFTSVNAVRAVRNHLSTLGLDARCFAGIKIAAVGGVTAASLREIGIEPELIPSGEQSARGMLEDWPPYDPDLDPINRVLLPRADIATDTLIAGLQEMGWDVDDVTAYRTVRAAPPPAPIRESIKGGDFDAVLFTSSSTVRNMVGIAGKPHPRTIVACIGPATAKTAEEHGLRVDVLAPEANIGALITALADFARARRQEAKDNDETPLRPSQARTPARRRKRS